MTLQRVCQIVIVLFLSVVMVKTAYSQCCGNTTTHKPECGSYLPGPLGIRNNAIPFSDNGVTQAKVETLLNKFRAVFPMIAFSQDWEDPTVNAVAFGTSDGQRNVVIFGGMLRHPFMDLEGITIILAHEVGHHYGNTDKAAPNPTTDSLARRYEHGAFCEDQSDFWATRVGMRLLLNYDNPITYNETSLDTFDWGAFTQKADSQVYTDTATKGIVQTNALLTGGLFHDYDSYVLGARFADAANCGHPPALCRKLIYQAGANRVIRPACSGITAFALNNFQPTTIESYKSRLRDRVDFSSGAPSPVDLIQQLRDELKAVKADLVGIKEKLENK